MLDKPNRDINKNRNGDNDRMGKRINLVPHVGVGLAYTTSYDGYDHMIDTGTGVQATSTSAIKPIITRLGVTIQYILK